MTARIKSALRRVLALPGSMSFRRFDAQVDQAMELSKLLVALGDGELRAAAAPEPRERSISAPALAAIAEASRRVLGLSPHREQLVGACALISGHAVEMDTGEGKTLVGAIASAYLALTGRKIHVISINDYLAERDADWMRPLYDALDVSVGPVTSAMPADARRLAYRRQVVYASISEIGYDVLRDRFITRPDERVAPAFDVAIVDEADAVMIDEAMSPLVLAGEDDSWDSDILRATDVVADLISERDYTIDEDGATVSFTESGLDVVEDRLGGIDLYSGMNTRWLTLVNLALHARVLVHRDVDYILRDGSIKLVSASRGRVAALQRWPDGLHAAVEAKEGLTVSGQGVILDTLTIQDLLLRYEALAGMSGTVLDVSEELMEFYRLASGRVEPHKPSIRSDAADVVFHTRSEMRAAVLREIQKLHLSGQPILVGTQSVAESEELGQALDQVGLEVRVLNAKNDAREASVIARAGELDAITISTQMSGRGTDIVLGGTDGADRDRVVAIGGLAVLAVGHYPSRRLDAQLRGRSGRQGDPGMSATFSSLEDELVAVNAPDMLRTADSRQRQRFTLRQRRALVASAQRIAEGGRLDRHRSTWALNRAIARQREFVLDVRERVLRAGAPLDELRALAPEAVLSLGKNLPRDRVAELLREVLLLVMDDHWSSHLAFLQEIRDGIHLRVLAGEDPTDAFHMIALEEFDGWMARVYQAVISEIEKFGLSDGHSQSELRRPSATWTYMLSDNPLGDAMHRALRHRRSERRN